MSDLVLVVPGPLETPTGGYGYDRRIIEGLRARGWAVNVCQLDDCFPSPTAAALDGASHAFASMPAGALVLVDGLAGGALPDVVERERSRLRLVALVHHPLAWETGLDAGAAARLEASERRTLRSVRRVVVTSRRTAAALTSFGVADERVDVVEPGTDPAPLARGSGGDALHFVCVASVTPRKGHEVLIDALSRCRDRDWRLTIVGSLDRHPPTGASLRARVMREQLEDRVVLAGEVPPSDVSRFYDRADVFVLPTLYEGYGMVVAEALARGLPVVTSATGAAVDLVTPESWPDAGVVVPPGDVDALTAALRRIIDDSAWRAGLVSGARAARARLPTWASAAAAMEGVLARAGLP